MPEDPDCDDGDCTGEDPDPDPVTCGCPDDKVLRYKLQVTPSGCSVCSSTPDCYDIDEPNIFETRDACCDVANDGNEQRDDCPYCYPIEDTCTNGGSQCLYQWFYFDQNSPWAWYSFGWGPPPGEINNPEYSGPLDVYNCLDKETYEFTGCACPDPPAEDPPCHATNTCGENGIFPIVIYNCIPPTEPSFISKPVITDRPCIKSECEKFNATWLGIPIGYKDEKGDYELDWTLVDDCPGACCPKKPSNNIRAKKAITVNVECDCDCT